MSSPHPTANRRAAPCALVAAARRPSLTHWRQRLGEEQLAALLQESLSVAHQTGALATRDLERVVVDTTVQPKAIAHPTEARLVHRAIEKITELTRRNFSRSAAFKDLGLH